MRYWVRTSITLEYEFVGDKGIRAAITRTKPPVNPRFFVVQYVKNILKDLSHHKKILPLRMQTVYQKPRSGVVRGGSVNTDT